VPIDVLQRCFAGVETRGDVLWLNLYWPRRLGILGLSLLCRDHNLTLSVIDHTVLVRGGPGDLAPIQVGCHGQVRELGHGQSLEFAF
jgi:trehalose/maltose hydrolase-like predicted phosphorylase